MINTTNTARRFSALNTTQRETQKKTQRERERFIHSNGVPLGRAAILGGVLLLGLLLTACPDSSGADGNGASVAYTCTNGTAADGTTDSNDTEKCTICNEGFIITADNRCNHRYICNNGVPTENTDATGDNVTQCASCITGYFVLNQTCAVNSDDDNDGVLRSNDVDDDNNGLIEVHNLTMLHNVRYNLAGTTYDDEEADTDSGDAGSTAGAPTTATTNCSTATGGVYLCGYELTQNLTFDTGADGTFTQSNGTYTLDSKDHNPTYFPVTSGAGGWLPIGDSISNSFRAIFEGNGHTITGLAIIRNQTHIGMFGAISAGAHIRNVGLVANVANYNGGSTSSVYAGGLVGQQLNGSITASYATGNVNGSVGNLDCTGGLVGLQRKGSITASYVTGNVNGGGGSLDYTGGLVGYQAGGSITASYATGSADGGRGDRDLTGGLVGIQVGGSITASYASGNVNGSEGDNDYTGGLVGGQPSGGSITASYATGNANGGDGDNDRTGGLVGDQAGGSITASYAIGSADGGAGSGDYVGQLIGIKTGGSHNAIYGFGTKSGHERNGIDTSTLPSGVTPSGVTPSGVTPSGVTTLEALTAANLTGCVGIANEKAYTTEATCKAVSKTAYTWDDATATCSGTDTGIDYAVFTSESDCIATTKMIGVWNGDLWNAAASGTAGAWDFGTAMQAPALKYADYDGSTGNDYNCNQFPSDVTCGTTLLPGQRD